MTEMTETAPTFVNLPKSPYSDFGPPWLGNIFAQLFENGLIPQAGIENSGGKRKSWIANNYDVFDRDSVRRLAVVQHRTASGKPGRYTNVSKTYYLVGRRADGEVFAIQAPVIKTTARIDVALQRLGKEALTA